MTREDLAENLLVGVTRRLPEALAELAMEDRLRLAGLERFAGAVLVGLRAGLWARAAAHLGAEAEEQRRRRHPRPTAPAPARTVVHRRDPIAASSTARPPTKASPSRA